MILTLFFLFLILWFVGMISAHMFGGLIHVLLFLAAVTILIELIRGRNPV